MHRHASRWTSLATQMSAKYGGMLRQTGAVIYVKKCYLLQHLKVKLQSVDVRISEEFHAVLPAAQNAVFPYSVLIFCTVQLVMSVECSQQHDESRPISIMATLTYEGDSPVYSVI